MASLDLGSLVAHLRLDDSNFTAVQRSVEKSLTSLGTKVEYFGFKISAAIGAPLTLLGRSMTKEFARFDQAMAKSMAVMEDSSASMRKEMEATALELSTRVATSAVSLAEGYFELGQAGLSAAQSMKLLPVVERFAYAGTMDLSTAVSYLTKTQRSLGMEMKDPIKNMESMRKVSDNLTYAAIESTGEIVDFSEAMKNAGPMLRVMNKSVEEGVAALMALANQGHVGSEAGTQLYMTYRDLQRAFITHKGVWDAFSLSVYDSSGKMLLLQDIVAQLEGHFNNLSDEELRTTLMMLGFQDRSLRATQALIGHSDAMKKFYKDLENVGGLTEKVANQYLKAFSAQMDILANKFKIIKIAIGGIIADQLAKLNAVMDNLLRIWKDLDEPTKRFIVYFGEFLIVLGPIVIALGIFLKTLGSVLGIIRVAISPLGLLVGAITYLGLQSQFVADIFGKSFKSILKAVSDVSDGIRNWTQKDSAILAQYVKLIALEIDKLRLKFLVLVDFFKSDAIDYSAFGDVLVAAITTGIEAAVVAAYEGGARIAQALADGYATNYEIEKETDRRYRAAQGQYQKKQKEWTWNPLALLRPAIEMEPSSPELWGETKSGVIKDFMQSAAEDARGATSGFSTAIESVLQVGRAKISALMSNFIDPVAMAKLQDGLDNVDNIFVEKGKTLRKDLQELFAGLVFDFGELNSLMQTGLEEQVQGQVSVTGEPLVGPTNMSKDQYEGFRREAEELLKIEERRKKVSDAQNDYIQQQRQAIAKVSEPILDQNKAYAAQLQLLEDEKTRIETMIGDNQELGTIVTDWYEREVMLLQRKIALEAAVDPYVKEELDVLSEVYTTLLDQNKAYEVQVKLLEMHMRELAVYIKDEKLLADIYERQLRLLQRQRDIQGDDFFKGLHAGFEQLNEDIGKLGKLGADIAKTVMDGIGSAIADSITKAEDLGEAFRQIGLEVANMLIKWGAQKAILASLDAATSGSTGGDSFWKGFLINLGQSLGGAAAGGGGGGGGGGGSSSGGSNASTNQFDYQVGTSHRGGMVYESSSNVRLVNASVFAGAMRAHSGIGPGERAVIAKDDEGIFTPGQMKALGNRGMSDELLSEIADVLRQRQTINATVVDSREVVTRRQLESREGEKVIMHHVKRNL